LHGDCGGARRKPRRKCGWLCASSRPEHRFRRQHPIGSYVVDFACPGRKLAIELDGGQHAQQGEEDAARTQEIARRGYRVIRFWNNDVMHDLAGVLEVIRQEIGNGRSEVCPLLPSGGEGGDPPLRRRGG
jgi:very-short-patch-repair endonuclease